MRAADRKDCGTLTLVEFTNVVSDLKLDISSEDIRSIFNFFDK